MSITIWFKNSFIVVECNVVPEFYSITNGNGTYGRYYYVDEFIYTCDDGYIVNNAVTCLSDGNWSGVPGCVQIPTSSTFSTSNTFNTLPSSAVLEADPTTNMQINNSTSKQYFSNYVSDKLLRESVT